MNAGGKEVVFEGLGVSPGIAVGPAHLSEAGMPTVPEYAIRKSAVGAENERLKTAVERSGRQLRRLRDRARSVHGASGEDLGNLLDAYLQMLTGSRLVRGVERRITEQRINAEAAVQAEISDIAHSFEDLPDPYMAARADDVREAGARLIRNLTKAPFRGFSSLPQGSVVLAEEFSPADAALMDPRQVAGFATVLGGPEGHTAIMARSLGIPAVLGATGLTTGARDAGSVIIDGISGLVIVNPTPATLREYDKRREALRRERRRFARLRDLPAITRDETEITLSANVELPQETNQAMRHGAMGIGLLRSEFMFMNRDTPPSEEEQLAELSTIVRGMAGRPVTIRTLDVGGEKLAYSFGDQLIDTVNPALGLRAIRFSLKHPKLLEDQISAILRVGALGPVRILLPMIATTGEVRRVREVIDVVARRLKRRREPIADPLPPLGVMIEVPGAALAADALARVSDFFAIGTNDLTMYTLAIDRADEQVAHLYNPLHPAVLRLIQFTAEAALRARIPFSVCGEIAGDPRYTALLLGLGVRDLSMAAGSLPRVKQRVRSLELTAATVRAQAIMEQADTGRIATLLDDFNGLA
ncbi:MAG: phosphoenolpyruvate--protein phosphotransferase [Rhodospirillaceae bacterium]|nr:phosphoenolpyruvate--protein phosphotransferase [Rhodospirillaceae bacterium]